MSVIGNLNAIANSQITSVNDNVAAVLWVALPPIIVNFKQVPQYNKLPVAAQVQAMTSGDVRQLDSLNIQGAEKIIFLNGASLAIIRVQDLGGNLIVFQPGVIPEGTTWKIVASMEQWGPTWCKVAVTLQDDDLSGQ